MIPITKPFLPPKQEYEAYLKTIWETGWITNNGQLLKKLENKIANYLQLDDMLFLSNGTISLQIAIKALELEGDIITTPFSYIATTSAIVWEGCKPVFVDIDPKTLNINPENIEEAITDRTTAILATHIFGNPCDIDEIERIGQKHNIKIIYDAAHCFGVQYNGRSIYSYGDISVASFHATKLYHAVEGGGIFTKSRKLFEKISYMRNFGHDGFYKYSGLGINGKNSEFHAAMGLCNLNYINEIIKKRKTLSHFYDKKLEMNKFEKPVFPNNCVQNYCYYPVIFNNPDELEQCADLLEKNGIQTRRYFKPCLDTLDYVESAHLPVCREICERVLCLPLYYDLTEKEIDRISSFINQ